MILKDVDDPQTSPLYRVFKAAVRQVASKNALSNAWLNDVIGDFLREESNVPEGTLWRRYDMLEVYVPSSEYILALKMLAGRQKDQNDILALSQQLHIQTSEQAQQLLDGYIPDKQVQQLNKVERVLVRFFPN